MDALATAPTPDGRHKSAPDGRWTLTRCCAELLLLAGFVLPVRTLLPRAQRTVPHSAEYCAALLGVLLAGSYYVLTVLLRRLRRGRVAGRKDAETALNVALRRAAPAVVAAAVILVPYALATYPGWVVLTAVLAGGVGLLEWLSYRSRSGRAVPDGACEAPSASQADRIDDLRRFARRHGLPDAHIVLADDDNRASAAYLPTRPGATFVVTGRLIELLSPAELRAAFAHEVAHHELGHSPKAAAAGLLRKLAAVMAVACLLATTAPTDSAPWALVRLGPVVLLGWYLAYLLLAPLVLAYQRRQEAQAHRRALEMTGDGEASVSGLRKIASANDCAREPAWWEKWLLLGSPSLSEAVALAERYAADKSDS